MKVLTDTEKIKFLEERHELILKWLKKQSDLSLSYKKPIPGPLWFCYLEDHQNQVRAAEDHNRSCEHTAATYLYVIEAIENGTKSMLAKLEPPFNEYEI